MKLAHTAVTCSSLESSDRFFIDIIGLEKKKSGELNPGLAKDIFGIETGCSIVLYQGDNFAVEVIIPGTMNERRPRFDHLCLEVESMDEFLKKCRIPGLEVRRIPKGEKTLVFVKDFDENLYEVTEKKV